ncbi:xanthine dehydrogenase family protein molybdopterin-binding subunit [Castellaniella sp.]|uniref:xanthine dehydrogenase family protein molybdopterin-binding subunit n=1 Tax=Castellaniella sp. TaxID=1955812 RepID=UPI0035666ABC
MSPLQEEFKVIGQSIERRPELSRFLRGQGCFVDDVSLPGMLHAVVVRSTHAHAHIRRIDTAAARALDGVVAIFGPDAMQAARCRIPVRLNPYSSLDPFLQPPLACARVRYVGEPVLLVVATSRYLAEDAVAHIEIDYDPLPAVTDAEADSMPALLYDAFEGNVASAFSGGFGDLDAAFAEADEVFELSFHTGRQSAVPIETRGLVAHWDAGRERLDVWGPTKVTHFNRSVLADLLSMAESRIHFHEPDVGGGFGARGEFYPEDVLIPMAAIQLGRPVKWIEDRMEHLMAINHSRQQAYRMKAGVMRDGRLCGIQVDLVNDMGAYMRTHGIIVPEMSAGYFPGPYQWGAYRFNVRCIMTNKTPTGTYRGPGRYECNTVRERVLDVIARRLGMDPVELRRRNLIQPGQMPYPLGTRALGEDVVYDSGDYPAVLQHALELSGYDARRRALKSEPPQGRVRRGLGIGCFVEKTGKGPFEGARLVLAPDGTLEVATGGASLGQGIETSLAQIAAEVLALDPRDVVVRHGDTDLIQYGVGSFASRTTVMAGNACFSAAHALKARILQVAADLLQLAPEALQLRDAAVHAPDGRSRPLSEVAAQAGPRYGRPALEVTDYFRCDHMVYACGAVVAEVLVDLDTCKVSPQHVWVAYDAGTVINPAIVAGQVEGGAVQAIGGALLEEFFYDDSGQLMTGSFMDYLLPVADDVGQLHHVNVDRSPSPLNPLGVKGVGELGVVGTGAAIANAVADALADSGDRVDHIPMSPQRIWGWLQAAGELDRTQTATTSH